MLSFLEVGVWQLPRSTRAPTSAGLFSRPIGATSLGSRRGTRRPEETSSVIFACRLKISGDLRFVSGEKSKRRDGQNRRFLIFDAGCRASAQRVGADAALESGGFPSGDGSVGVATAAATSPIVFCRRRRRVSAIFLSVVDPSRIETVVGFVVCAPFGVNVGNGTAETFASRQRLKSVVLEPRRSERGRRTLDWPLGRRFVERRDVCRDAAAQPRSSRRRFRDCA